MPWFHLLAYFFAGVFFANFVPHFVSGVLGRTFPTPFASPPFRGQSPPPVNVLYGLGNLALAYLLLLHVGDFQVHNGAQVCVFGLGLGTMGLLIPRSLARLQSAEPR